jgi:hypothetical protein
MMPYLAVDKRGLSHYNKEGGKMAYEKVTLASFPVFKEQEHPLIMAKEYRGIPHAQVKKIAALRASDNGRCWWIYQFLTCSNLIIPRRVL